MKKLMCLVVGAFMLALCASGTFAWDGGLGRLALHRHGDQLLADTDKALCLATKGDPTLWPPVTGETYCKCPAGLEFHRASGGCVTPCPVPPTSAAITEDSTGRLFGVVLDQPSREQLYQALVSHVKIFAEPLAGVPTIFGYADGLPIYLSVIPKPDAGVTPVAVSPGAAFGFDGPKVAATYDVVFCQPGSEKFDLVLDENAGTHTFGMLMLGQIPTIGTIPDFIKSARQRVPLFDEAAGHFMNGMSATVSATRVNEFRLATAAMLKLALPRNAAQLAQLIATEADFGVKWALTEEARAKLDRIPQLARLVGASEQLLRVVEIGLRIEEMILAFDVLIMHTNGDLTGPGPIVVRIEAK